MTEAACKDCLYKKLEHEGLHCYMFKVIPNGPCMKFRKCDPPKKKPNPK